VAGRGLDRLPVRDLVLFVIDLQTRRMQIDDVVRPAYGAWSSTALGATACSRSETRQPGEPVGAAVRLEQGNPMMPTLPIWHALLSFSVNINIGTADGRLARGLAAQQDAAR
jgi:hypothetical protein